MKLKAVEAAILGLVLFSTLPSATAQSNCKEVKGQVIQSPSSGPVTNAGDLTGSATIAFFGGASPTNDPTTFSFTSDFTITANQGELKARQVNVYDTATGVTAGFARIDPAASQADSLGRLGTCF